ncbi:uncharacterized protein LACBIDRAFT_310849 [Laccaria bicolor S238N-H82]|uniref:Predicted protein n=1 Tax=Laccaria bicolor (strain S238N-H82 / ATCC MYA-4686) TaxID=486041 RepID=B0DV83_LACBS|nr:uncharacterized protein LACBIDRAFT_310849 [Laccaria bicolor S238N-H82]EDR01533.1 predicted protein [Laccaria bicolor S238N-H82]|eukprot:XP_001887885.1 predicted protein [Laccaria bicolor S238N-H82]
MELIKRRGQPSFVVENLLAHLQVHEKKSGATDVNCELCGEKTTISKMRVHVGKHILYSMRRRPDVELKSMGASPCGFCGLDSGCQTQLTFKKNGVAVIKSTCPFHYEKMQYKAALEPTKASPCTNIPIHCRLCAPLKVSG